MKYIRTESEPFGLQEIFVFPRTVDHDVMMEALARMKDCTRGSWSRVVRAPVSAGFVDPNGRCYGESITLHLHSEPEDTEILAKQMAGR